MSKVMVRYTVKPEAAATNEALVRNVYAELNQSRPTGFHYATFVLDDGVSFVHIASKENESSPEPLMQIAAFKEFLGGLKERAVEPPVSLGVREVGSFAFWGM
jgi:hypothetical protein